MAGTILGLSLSSPAAMVITEWMYQGAAANGVGEFIEVTNTGSSEVNLAGWSYDDSDAVAGSFPLAGVLAAGQSFIITDITADAFRAAWGLASSVLIFGENTNNLSRGDEINLFNATTLVDRLTYADNGAAGGPRTQNFSGITDPAYYGLNFAAQWRRSAVGDGISWLSLSGDVGNPGIAVIPEPSVCLLAGVVGLAFGSRRKR